MGKTEIIVFIVLTTVIVIAFLVSLVSLLMQYRRRKREHEEALFRSNEHHRTELLQSKLEIQQQTMQYIGREIHDSVTQKLTLASIHTQRLEFEGADPTIKSKLQLISSILNDSLEELRALSRNLTDSSIQDFSLEQLIERECQRVCATGICLARLETTGSAPQLLPEKTYLFRTVQEFIQNSLKHSRCRLITVSLQFDAQLLNLTLADDGIGFEVAQRNGQGIGLNNMRRRVQALNGSFDLSAEPGKGTVLQVRVPLSH